LDKYSAEEKIKTTGHADRLTLWHGFIEKNMASTQNKMSDAKTQVKNSNIFDKISPQFNLANAD
jgi:hypothetical protein